MPLWPECGRLVARHEAGGRPIHAGRAHRGNCAGSWPDARDAHRIRLSVQFEVDTESLEVTGDKKNPPWTTMLCGQQSDHTVCGARHNQEERSY